MQVLRNLPLAHMHSDVACIGALWPLFLHQDLSLGMQERMFDDFLLALARKLYMPASRYTPCSNAYQSPADVNSLATEQCNQSHTHGEFTCSLAKRSAQPKHVYQPSQRVLDDFRSLPVWPRVMKPSTL